MRVVVYCRVSTEAQDATNQLPALQDYAARRGWEIVATYQEAESAWCGGHQRELARAIEDARRGKYQVLLVWALDRLSREGALAILSLVSRLGRYGVKVVSLQESWTEAPGELQEVLLALAGWVARMESQRRSERTKAGLQRVKANGVRLGRPPGAKDKRRRKKGAPRQPIYSGLSGGAP